MKKQEAESLNASIKPIKEKLAEIEKQVDELIVKLPNLPSEKVPKGRTPAENETVKEGGNKPTLEAGAMPHWDLAKKYRLIDFELGEGWMVKMKVKNAADIQELMDADAYAAVAGE